MRKSTLVLLGLCALVIVSCTITIQALRLPSQVGFGQVFPVQIQGTITNARISGNIGGCVLQVPKGFQLKSWSLSSGKLDKLPINNPKLLNLYKAEAGHVLFAFTAKLAKGNSSPPSPVILTANFIAPNKAGLATFKVSGAGENGAGSSKAWTITSPAGVSDFSKITKAPYVATTLVLSVVQPPMFVKDAKGLPFPNTQLWGGLALADVDHDGRLDLGTSARLGKGPFVYRSTAGSGGTQWVYASAGLEKGAGHADVDFGDVNGDGFLDVACSNGRVLLGDGKGGFKAGPSIPFGGEGVSLADVNGDGRADVVIGGHLSDRVKFFFSDATKGWVESSKGLVNTGNGNGGGHRILLRDLTGDGKMDIIWCRELLVGGTTIWQGDGKGNWTQLPQKFGEAKGLSTYWEIELADVDGDGVDELVCGGWQAYVGVAGGGVRIWKKTGPTTWKQMTNTGLPQFNETRDVAVADFDGDGVMDIAAGVTQGRFYGIMLYRGNGKGGFTAWPKNGGLQSTGLSPVNGLDAGDFDGDARPDLVAATFGGGVVAWRNTQFGFYRFGKGCKGALKSAPSLQAQGNLRIGTNLSLGIQNSPLNGGGLLLFGSSRARLLGLPLLPWDLGTAGAKGCTLYTSMDLFSLPIVLNAGSGSLTLPIPNQSSLVDAVFFTQGFIPAKQANGLGLLWTDAASLKLGR